MPSEPDAEWPPHLIAIHAGQLKRGDIALIDGRLARVDRVDIENRRIGRGGKEGAGTVVVIRPYRWSMLELRADAWIAIVERNRPKEITG